MNKRNVKLGPEGGRLPSLDLLKGFEAAARLQNDVLRLILLGDPHRALGCADGAARAVADLERLVAGEPQPARFQFDAHWDLLLNCMHNVHAS